MVLTRGNEKGRKFGHTDDPMQDGPFHCPLDPTSCENRFAKLSQRYWGSRYKWRSSCWSRWSVLAFIGHRASLNLR